MVTKDEFRFAMSRLGAAVNIITSDGAGGLCGFTASAVCSVTDDPPTVLVCINRSSSSNALIKKNGVLCVNVLAPAHEEISGVFAGLTRVSMAERFDAAAFTIGTTGSPILSEASVALDCEISEIAEVGTHSIIFARVVQIRVSDQPGGLIYYNRAYHPVGHL